MADINGIAFKNNKVDYLLSITAVGQSLLAILQLFMNDALHLSPEVSNFYRILLTAAPILLSLVFICKRKIKITLFVYLFVSLLLMLTTIIWPNRWHIMKDDVLKFLLPVVIPTGLCVASVRKCDIFFKCCKYIAIISALIGLFYTFSFLLGRVHVDGYSIAFSYSLLLPILILLMQSQNIYKIISVILMIAVLAIGSRGAFICSIMFVVIVYLWGKVSFGKFVARLLFIVPFLLLFYRLIINGLVNLFSLVGIKSRTMSLLLSDELITHNSGRDDLTNAAWTYIDKHWFLGNGVWADREYFGIYCHNILIEFLLDYGFIIAGALFVIFILKNINILKALDNKYKLWMMLFFIGCIIPLLVSSSYLISYNFALYLGIMYMFSNKKSNLS